MTEDLEFSISQYVDGTLPDAERMSLEIRLQQDREAQAILAEYRALSVHLAQALPLPNVRWDVLAQSISSAIDAQAEQTEQAYRMPAWIRFAARPLAIAASVLILAGMGVIVVLHHAASVSPSIVHPWDKDQFAASTDIVIGPAGTETAHGPAEIEVSVGPSATAKNEPTMVQYSDDVVTRPSRVAIASGVVPAHDTIELPADPIDMDMQ
jgi:anti-sigma factor RsiW